MRNDQGKLSWNDKVIEPLGGNRIKIGNKEFNLTPKNQKAFTNTNYNFRNMNDDDILNFTNILKTVDYNPRQDSHSTRSKYLKNHLQDRVDKILNPSSSSSSTVFQIEPPSSESEDNLEGSGVSKITIPSNIIEIWTRLQVLLGLIISGHTNILTEASSLIDEVYKKGEIQTEQQYKMLLINLFLIKWNYLVNF